MVAQSLDAEIDRLYQVRLDEFTAARNALAKEAGKNSGEIKRLQKPPLAAWAINQVYWKRRPTFDALKKTASALQSTHTAVLSGKRGDLRAAGGDLRSVRRRRRDRGDVLRLRKPPAEPPPPAR